MRSPLGVPGTAMALFLMVSAALSGAVIPADAQTPQGQSAPQVGTAATPTPAQLALARELLHLNGIADSFAASVPDFFDQANTTLIQTRPELGSDLTKVFAQLKPEFIKRADELTERGALLYAQLLSEDELKTTVAFFKTGPGRKYVEAQPAFMQGIVTDMEVWRRQISTDLMTRVRVEMQKKGHQL